VLNGMRVGGCWNGMGVDGCWDGMGVGASME
jgi:hypothetical protein